MVNGASFYRGVGSAILRESWIKILKKKIAWTIVATL
jgi:hypothetical protein